MAGAETEKKPVKQSAIGGQGGPDWASGLKQLYNSVVDEPLPDSFKHLLAQLDEEEGKK